MESEIEETDYDSVEETSSVLSTEEWEDESDSWETDNGLTTEDDSHVNNADVTDTATPTPTPTGSTTFIIPIQEGSKAGVTSPTKGVSGEEGEAVASPASGGGGKLFVLLHLLYIILFYFFQGNSFNSSVFCDLMSCYMYLFYFLS